MPIIGTLSTVLTLDSSKMEAGARKAKDALRGVESSAGNVIKKMIGLAAATAGPAALVAFTKHGLSAIDANAKLARSIDGTVDGLRALKQVAGDSGVDGLDSSISKLNIKLGEASKKGSAAGASLNALGVDMKALQKADVDEKIALIADRIKATGMNSQEAANHLKNLGFEQKGAAAMFMAGGDAIRDARIEVDKYGLSLSQVDAVQIETANDAISRTKSIFEVVSNRLAVNLAPILEYVANLINDAAKESGGFKDQIDGAIDFGIRGFARLADIIAGVNRTVKILGIGVVAFAAAAVHDFYWVAKAITDGPVNQVNQLIKLFNSMGKYIGFEIDLVENPLAQGLQREMDLARGIVDQAQSDIRAILMEDMPSTVIERKIDDIRQKAKAAAEEVVRNQQRMRDAFVTQPVEESDEDKRERERANARLQAIRDSLMTEEELRTTQYARQIEDMRLLHDTLGLEDAAFKELSLQAEQQYMEDIKSIRERGMSEIERIQAMSLASQVGLVTGELGNMFSAYSSHSKKMNKAAQGFGTMSATISMYQGMAEALKLPFPSNLAAAAKVGGAGLSFLAGIKGAGGGGGGGAGSAASSTAISAPPAQRFDVSLSGFNPNQAMGMNQMGGVMDFINTRIRAGETFGGFSY